MRATPERIRELARQYRVAMIRLGATDADFRACGIDPPSLHERLQIERIDHAR